MISNLTVPVLNRYDLLERMLESIDHPVRHLLIVDNGGGLESVDTPGMVDKVSLMSMPANFGVAASWNLGVKAFRNNNVFFFASNDIVFEPGALKALAGAKRHAVTLSHLYPHFHTFAVGVDVVRRVGLFDESFFPAYAEDVDYLWRCERAGVEVVKKFVSVKHDNSSTINSDIGYKTANQITQTSNLSLLNWKKSNNRAEALPFDVLRWRRHDWG